MAYNLSTLSYMTSHVQIFSSANSFSDGWWGLGVVIGVFVVSLLFLLRGNEAPESLAGASFISFFIGLGLRISGLMTNDYVFILSIVAFVGSAVVLVAARLGE